VTLEDSLKGSSGGGTIATHLGEETSKFKTRGTHSSSASTYTVTASTNYGFVLHYDIQIDVAAPDEHLDFDGEVYVPYGTLTTFSLNDRFVLKANLK
jgi:hypothetical protein